MSNDKAKRISDRVIPVALESYILPCHLDRQPWIVMGKDGAPYVAVFSTKEKLEEAIDRMSFKRDDLHLMKIDETAEFVSSLREQGVRVMIDPWLTPEGNTRWIEPLVDA